MPMHHWFHKKCRFVRCIFLAGFTLYLCIFALTGCDSINSDKVADLDYTIIGTDEIPDELQEIIEQKKTEPFKLTYNDQEDLYIAVGYGTKESGGYSIQVPQVYVTETEIVVETQLIGPTVPEETSNGSTPYVVIKTEFRDMPITFK